MTTQGESWLEAPTAERWTIIATGFRAALPDGVRTPDGGFAAPATWATAYPLDPDWPARLARLRRVGESWGLLSRDDRTEFVWTAALRRGEPADASALVAHLPAEIDRVYLQADLTAIAPGPLAPPLDLRLRSIAVRESRAQASTYRFTAHSLGSGMTEGETAGSIRAFLTELSLTGIPQPLDYLIDSTAARHGLVRVRDASGRTRVESTDASLLEAIAIDQALRPSDSSATETPCSRGSPATPSTGPSPMPATPSSPSTRTGLPSRCTAGRPAWWRRRRRLPPTPTRDC
nr:hypothetical protein GCM10025699_36160 [Microbacterium flavescens]